MTENEKRVVIVAGANGVGKTTFALQFLQENDFEFLNADEIAKQLSAENPTEKKISAGKLFFRKLRETIAQNNSVLLESTLSGRYLQKFFEVWQNNDYQIQIVFIFVESPEVSIARIAERVKKGGHFVPDEDVRRRFERGKENFWRTYKDLADSWALIYNSEEIFQEIAFGEKDDFLITDEDLLETFIGGLNEKKTKISLKTYQQTMEVVRIGNKAVRRAQEENRRLGLPNVYSRNNKLIYEMPDGKIVIKEPKE